MSGFRTPEIPREQMVLWERRLEDAIPEDHQVRHLGFLLGSAAFADTFREMERSYVLVRGKPPYHPRDLAGLCCKNSDKGRLVSRDQYENHRERLRRRMATEDGREIYKRRKYTVEPRIGHIKHNMGVRRFLRRGMEKVKTEWTMACTVVNLGILLRHWDTVVTTL